MGKAIKRDAGVVAAERVRKICLALPSVTERPSHGSPTYFVNDKKSFVMSMDNHHNDGIVGLWCAAGKEEQQALLQEDPIVFFYPPYVGYRGWVGIRLDTSPGIDDARLTEIIEGCWCNVAPKGLLNTFLAERG